MENQHVRNEILEHRRRAGQNLRIEPELREYEYEVETMRTGEEVLADAGLTLDDVHIEPRHLVRSAYEHGDPLRIDPFNRATSRLHWLRFADHTGNPDSIHVAMIHASKALRQYGIPSEVEDVYAIDHRAEEFQRVDVLAAMPVLTEDTPWLDRLEGVQHMLGAFVATPRDHPARTAIREYTWHLATPSVDYLELSFFEEWVREQLAPDS